VAAAIVLVLLVLFAVAGPWFVGDPNDQSLVDRLMAPSAEHWLGTDRFGRDNLSRLISATRVTLLAAAQGVGLAVGFGVPTGLVAGYLGGRIEGWLNWLAETMMSLPPLILALAILGIRGPGLTNAMIAIGVILIPRFFRVARTTAKSIAAESYIEAAVASGCPVRTVMFRHVLPNASGPLLVQTSFSVGLAIVAEASLSFLGLGVQDPQASWGSMIGDAFATSYESSFGLIAPSVIITVTIASFAVIGDSLRDAISGEVS
jgi:peptide/nickel transport system permease protein